MKINGIVKSGVSLSPDGKVSYDLASDGKRYCVSSRGIQAVKDVIFVREGQQMSIKADYDNITLYTKESRIDIQAEMKNRRIEE